MLSAGFLLPHCPHRMLTLLLPDKTALNTAMHPTFSSLPAVSLRSGCWKLSASPPALVLPAEASCELQETQKTSEPHWPLPGGQKLTASPAPRDRDQPVGSGSEFKDKRSLAPEAFALHCKFLVLMSSVCGSTNIQFKLLIQEQTPCSVSGQSQKILERENKPGCSQSSPSLAANVTN